MISNIFLVNNYLNIKSNSRYTRSYIIVTTIRYVTIIIIISAIG